MAAFGANRLITEVTGPALVTLASVGLALGALAIETAWQFDAGLAVLALPAIKTCADERFKALAVVGVAVGAGRPVAVGSLPKSDSFTVGYAVALERVVTDSVLTSWQGNAGVAEVALPSNLASAEVRPDAVSVLTRLAVVVADRDGAGIAQVTEVRVFRFPPPGQANHVGVVVTEVAVGLLEVFGNAWVLVVLKWREDSGPQGVARDLGRQGCQEQHGFEDK